MSNRKSVTQTMMERAAQKRQKLMREFAESHGIPLEDIPMSEPPEPGDVTGIPTFHCGNKPEDGANLNESDGIPKALITSPQAKLFNVCTDDEMNEAINPSDTLLFGTSEKLTATDAREAEVKFANILTIGSRRKDPSNYSMKNLYHWSSKVLKAYSEGDIIVMAENVEKARNRVYAMFDPLEDGNAFEDSYLQMLHFNDDPDYLSEFTKKFNELREDLDKEPTIVRSDVVLIRGSD